MPASSDDPTMHKITGSRQPSPLTPDGRSDAVHLDREQMFHLIDGVLPFEACLYHQVLPLSLEGSVLNLGMVDREDHGVPRLCAAHFGLSQLFPSSASDYL
uniref:Uncharacterized protein n=1 Tax=Desertifilum tharense IPPAS B-1220 TaxID=1781255 RepID=A0ACD5GZI3_9CYAN